MPLGSWRVEIAWDSGFATPEGDRTWTDVSAYVEGEEGGSIGYGRSDELSVPDPNSFTVTLDNRDGRFTPDKASSPYYPNVKKGRPIRATVTYNGVDYIRFTGYVDEWPLVWPDGSDAAATITVSASSRRARLGNTAPLTSAIRAAYLATDPLAYWPMSESAGQTTGPAGIQAFRDVTNTVNLGRTKGSLGAFYTTASAPVLEDGTPGPTDEGSLVRVDKYTNLALYGTYPHYIGAGTAIKVDPSAGVTMETVARIRTSGGDGFAVTLMQLMTANQSSYLGIEVKDTNIVSGAAVFQDPVTGVLQYAVSGDLIYTATSGSSATGVTMPEEMQAARDGEIHHYALTLSGTDTLKFYFDGALVNTITLPSPYTFTQKLTNITLASDTYLADVWVGHAAVHERALSADEILSHAVAATSASESDAERVVRLAGRVGVPSAEIDVESSIAASLGPQSEQGRSAAEVLDELAQSIGGILYDTRAGHLALQARNHRYNQTAAFSLSAVAQEFESDLTATSDTRYLVNTVEVTRAGTEVSPVTLRDDDSIDAYGIYSQSLTVATDSDEEALSAAQNVLFRFADPPPRISQVTVSLPGLSTAQRANVLNADIGTLFNIASLPAQAPTDPMPLFLEGASESFTTRSHTITINATPGDLYTNVAVLNDAAHDVLDSGITLAY